MYSKDTGCFYLGFNYETPAAWIGFSVHGEQCVTHNVLVHRAIPSVLVVSQTPCGHCRQFLNQFAWIRTLAIHIIALNGTFSIDDLLPHSFSPAHLPPITLTLPTVVRDTITLRGTAEPLRPLIPRLMERLKDCRVDNLPFHAAAALVRGDRLFVGLLIESCAHNPTFHPVNGAVTQLRLADHALAPVDGLIFIEREDAPFVIGTTWSDILDHNVQCPNVIRVVVA